MSIGGARLEEDLDRQTCLALLASTGAGRVAISIRALPAILPVQYAIAGDEIHIRTRPGTALARATNDAVVAFQVDGVEPSSGRSWSVHVTDVAHHDPPVDQDCVISIPTEHISGRRTAAGPLTG